MSFELWNQLQGYLEETKNESAFTSQQNLNQLIQTTLPLPIDFMRCCIGLRPTHGSVKSHSFFLTPNLSFDYYEINTPA